MKKTLAMLPMVVILLGCSVGYKGIIYHDVVAVPYSPASYEWIYVGYGYPCCTLQGCLGFGWVNPFYFYEFTLNYYPDWYYRNDNFHPRLGPGFRGDYVRRTLRKDELSRGNPKDRVSFPDRMSGWPSDSPGSRNVMSTQPIGSGSPVRSRESVSASSSEHRISTNNGDEKRTGRKK